MRYWRFLFFASAKFQLHFIQLFYGRFIETKESGDGTGGEIDIYWFITWLVISYNDYRSQIYWHHPRHIYGHIRYLLTVSSDRKKYKKIPEKNNDLRQQQAVNESLPGILLKIFIMSILLSILSACFFFFFCWTVLSRVDLGLFWETQNEINFREVRRRRKWDFSLFITR